MVQNLGPVSGRFVDMGMQVSPTPLVEAGVVVWGRSKKFLAMGPADTAKWDVPNASVTV